MCFLQRMRRGVWTSTGASKIQTLPRAHGNGLRGQRRNISTTTEISREEAQRARNLIARTELFMTEAFSSYSMGTWEFRASHTIFSITSKRIKVERRQAEEYMQSLMSITKGTWGVISFHRRRGEEPRLERKPQCVSVHACLCSKSDSQTRNFSTV